MAPITFTSSEEVTLTLQTHRLKCKQLEHEIKLVLHKHGETVDP